MEADARIAVRTSPAPGRPADPPATAGDRRRRGRPSASCNRLRDPVVSARGGDAGAHHRHALLRPDRRDRADLRARDDGRAVLGMALADAARRGAPRRPADPRQHPARGALDRAPVGADRRARRLRGDRAARHRGPEARRDRDRRDRPAVRVDLLLPELQRRHRASRSSPTSSTFRSTGRSSSRSIRST